LKEEEKLNKFRVVSLIVAVLLIAAPSFAETPFKDVPENHWAKWAVNDLVKLGVTQGYPDGTFRGSKNITRYETAIFLSKLAAAIGEGKAEEVDLSSIKADIQALKAEIAALKETPEEETRGVPITGSFMSRFRVANLFAGNVSGGGTAPKGPRFDYRLRTILSKNLGENASVKINLDTMDAGFNGGAEDLATKLLDAEGNLTIKMWGDNPLDIKVTAGPGPVVYSFVQDNVIPSEVGTVYMRPRNSIMAETGLGEAEITGGYTARTLSPSGEVLVDQVTLSIGQKFANVPFFNNLRLAGTWDYVAQNLFSENGNKPHDSRSKIDILMTFSDTFQSDLTFGFTGADDASEGTYLGFGISLIDPWETGTVISLKLHTVGAQYLHPDLLTAEADMIGLDYFDKYITNGIVDFGGEIAQVLSEDFTLKGKLDFRYGKDKTYGEDDPLSNSTIETALSYKIARSATLDFIYKVYQVPSNKTDMTSDVFGLSFLFKF